MHLIQKLYHEEHDFRPNTPKLTYMIATVPRSGSTYFALKLWQTGLLGAPMEYLNLPAAAREIVRRLGSPKLGGGDPQLSKEEVGRYWRKIKDLRTSPNGVFGFKMFKTVFQDIVARYPDVFDDIAPDYVIFLKRKDIVAQAVSLSRARKTNKWFAGPAPTHESYDFNHIAFCQAVVEQEYEYWEQVFSTAQINPIRVFYEDFLLEPETTIRRIMASMGITHHADAALPLPMIDRQSDEKSREWRTRYDSECSERPRPTPAPTA